MKALSTFPVESIIKRMKELHLRMLDMLAADELAGLSSTVLSREYQLARDEFDRLATECVRLIRKRTIALTQ